MVNSCIIQINVKENNDEDIASLVQLSMVAYAIAQLCLTGSPWLGGRSVGGEENLINVFITGRNFAISDASNVSHVIDDLGGGQVHNDLVPSHGLSSNRTSSQRRTYKESNEKSLPENMSKVRSNIVP